MIFETHGHYDDSAFDEDRDKLINSFLDNNIRYAMNVGANLETSKKSVELAEKYENIYGSVGVHPNDVMELNEDNMKKLKDMCHHAKVKAVGEIGLDYYYDEPEKSVQIKWFERQLELAEEVKLPVIIHSRDAAADTLSVMKNMEADKLGGVIHCFSYGKEMAREYLNMGYYIGVGGVVTFKNGKKLKEVVEYVPLSAIVLETDSPYLSPEPFRGKRNSALNIPYIAEQIALIKNISTEEVYEETFKNALKLYKLKDIK